MRFVVLLVVIAVLVYAYFRYVKPALGRGRAREQVMGGSGPRAATDGADAGPRAEAVSGPKAKHLALLSQTLVLRGDPAVVNQLVSTTITADPRFATEPAPDGIPRWGYDGEHPVVRLATAETASTLSVEEFTFENAFPQGGKVWERTVTTVEHAADRVGLEHRRGQQTFVPTGATEARDQTWTAAS